MTLLVFFSKQLQEETWQEGAGQQGVGGKGESESSLRCALLLGGGGAGRQGVEPAGGGAASGSPQPLRPRVPKASPPVPAAAAHRLPACG